MRRLYEVFGGKDLLVPTYFDCRVIGISAAGFCQVDRVCIRPEIWVGIGMRSGEIPKTEAAVESQVSKSARPGAPGRDCQCFEFNHGGPPKTQKCPGLSRVPGT